MKTAAAYVRVSDERQDEFSPDSQLKLIRDYCKRNDIELPDELIFYDDGISAKSVKKRKQFNDMIALAKQKEKPFEIILVWKFSRFARNQEESIVYKSLLRKNGVEVISVSEPIQDNPFGGLIERIIEWMDEYYLIRLSDEVRRGMTERATRGLPNTAPPYGYRMIDGEYRIVEQEAETVKNIFNMFINGVKTKKIADHLRITGIKNQYGNYIDNRMVDYILHNPCYIGYVRWNPNGRSASKRNFNNPEDILRKSTHEAIIDEDTFNKAQNMLEERKKAYPKYSRTNDESIPFMLKGLVKCDACGSTLVYNKKNNGVQCHKYARGVCGVSHFINLNSLNTMVIEALKKSATDLAFNIEFTKPKIASLTVDYDNLISGEKRKLDRAKQAYQAGVDSLEEYRETKKTIDKRIENLNKEKTKQELNNNKTDLKAFARSVSEVIELAESPDISEELKNEALRTILSKVIFYKPDKRVELYFHI